MFFDGIFVDGRFCGWVVSVDDFMGVCYFFGYVNVRFGKVFVLFELILWCKNFICMLVICLDMCIFGSKLYLIVMLFIWFFGIELFLIVLMSLLF